MQQRSNIELWLSFIAIIFITLAYIFMVTMMNDIPPASEFFGHSIGILGFVLMLMTETLYSIRKRSRSARWGRMSSWLNFHIFTGLVGPYLVLLHSSWKFNGLAGIVMLLTVIIVLSGFVGRYFYTAVPRTVDGIALDEGAIQHHLQQIDAELQRRLAQQSTAAQEFVNRQVRPILDSLKDQGAFLPLITNPFSEFTFRLRWWLEKNRLDTQTRKQLSSVEHLIHQRLALNRQVRTLAASRRLLALWHAVHIPIGMALFTAAFVHIIAAIYYATLLR